MLDKMESEYHLSSHCNINNGKVGKLKKIMQKYIINKMLSLENKKLGYRSYFLIYTIVFIFVVFFVFSWYFLTGRTFIWQTDGWDQHYKALIYYAKYLRSILSNIFFQHRLVIPAWDFSIGEGSDILQTLNYYVIGDPFTVLSVFVPVRFMYLYYNAMILLRLYLAGIAFSCLCFYTGKTSRCAAMAGSMTYVFCYWATLNAARHPYFLNPMIYFPMLILGIEKILRKERPYLFIVAVFISAVSNFYYFYVLVLVTVVYVVIRCPVSYRNNIKTLLQMFVQIGAASILGVILAAVILLPVFYTVLNDTRAATEYVFRLFYPLSYYSKLPSVFLTPSSTYWLCIGLSAPVLPAVFLMFCRRRKYGILKFLFIASIVVISIPALGQILNAFSYMSNKWCWAFALLSAYILTTMWPSLMELETKDKMALGGCTAVYSIVCFMLEYSRTTSTFAALFFVFIYYMPC